MSLKHIWIVVAAIVMAAIPASAQQSGGKYSADRREAGSQKEMSWQERIFMEYYVPAPGDTVFVDELPPAFVFPKFSKRDRRNNPDLNKYYRLVYNFNEVYPYTGVARKAVHDADSAIAGMNRIQKDRYVNKVQDQLLEDFSDIARGMTVSQGKLLCRLVDREVGKTSFDIVRDYKNGMAAGFWQGVAKLFGQDLKTPYDPEGEDRMTEYLIEKWEEGQFDALYYSLFLKWPKKIDIPSKYK